VLFEPNKKSLVLEEKKDLKAVAAKDRILPSRAADQYMELRHAQRGGTTVQPRDAPVKGVGAVSRRVRAAIRCRFSNILHSASLERGRFAEVCALRSAESRQTALLSPKRGVNSGRTLLPAPSESRQISGPWALRERRPTQITNRAQLFVLDPHLAFSTRT